MLVAQALPPGLKRFEEFAKTPEFRHLAEVIVVLFVIGQVVTIFAHWIASKAVADRGDATLGNGFKLWLYHLAAGFIWGMGLVMLLSMISRTEPWRLLIVGGGMLLLGLLVVFLIPMKIYRIGFWAALGLLLLSGLMQSVAVSAVQFAGVYAPFKGPRFTALRELTDNNLESQRRLFDRLLGKTAPDEIDRLLDDAMSPMRSGKSRAEREAAVTAIQRKLEERRRSLRPSDVEANAKFQRQLKRYKRLLEDVKGERAAGRSARVG
jgi:hypothetical protein